MKNLFKYAFMLMVVAMGAVVISSCSKDDDNNSGGGGVAGNATLIVDNYTYEMVAVQYSSSKPYKITFEGVDCGITIHTMNSSAFPSSLTTVSCDVNAGHDENGDYAAENVPVQCCHSGGNNFKFIINKANVEGHTVSFTYEGDISAFEYKKID